MNKKAIIHISITLIGYMLVALSVLFEHLTLMIILGILCVIMAIRTMWILPNSFDEMKLEEQLC